MSPISTCAWASIAGWASCGEVDVPVYANASPSAPTDRQSFDTMADAIVAAFVVWLIA